MRVDIPRQEVVDDGSNRIRIILGDELPVFTDKYPLWITLPGRALPLDTCRLDDAWGFRFLFKAPEGIMVEGVGVAFFDYEDYEVAAVWDGDKWRLGVKPK